MGAAEIAQDGDDFVQLFRSDAHASRHSAVQTQSLDEIDAAVETGVISL